MIHKLGFFIRGHSLFAVLRSIAILSISIIPILVVHTEAIPLTVIVMKRGVITSEDKLYQMFGRQFIFEHFRIFVIFKSTANQCWDQCLSLLPFREIIKRQLSQFPDE